MAPDLPTVFFVIVCELRSSRPPTTAEMFLTSQKRYFGALAESYSPVVEISDVVHLSCTAPSSSQRPLLFTTRIRCSCCTATLHDLQWLGRDVSQPYPVCHPGHWGSTIYVTRVVQCECRHFGTHTRWVASRWVSDGTLNDGNQLTMN